MEFAFGADRTAFDMLYEFWDLTEGAVVIWLEPGIKLIESFFRTAYSLLLSVNVLSSLLRKRMEYMRKMFD